MMKKLAVFLVVLAFSAPAFADIPTAVEDPKGAFEKAKQVVDVLDPQAELIYSLRKGESYQAWSAAVWKYRSEELILGSARIGYAVDKSVYGEFAADLEGLYEKYAPDNLKTTPVAGAVLKLTSKYARVGWALGYSFDGKSEHFVHGPVVGLAVKTDF